MKLQRRQIARHLSVCWAPHPLFTIELTPPKFLSGHHQRTPHPTIRTINMTIPSDYADPFSQAARRAIDEACKQPLPSLEEALSTEKAVSQVLRQLKDDRRLGLEEVMREARRLRDAARERPRQEDTRTRPSDSELMGQIGEDSNSSLSSLPRSKCDKELSK